jgi:hypothetical protein
VPSCRRRTSLLPPIPAALAALSLGLGLGDLQAGWGLRLGAAFGIALLGWCLAEPGRRRVGFIALNLAILAVYLWALDERELLSVSYSSTGLRASTARTEIQTTETPPAGVILIQAAEQIARRATHAPVLEPLPEPIRRQLLWPEASPLTGIRLRSAEGPEPLAGSTTVWQEVQEQHETWLPVARLASDQGQIEVEVVRPSTMVRVLLGAEDRGRGLVVELRPETHHLLITQVENGEIVRELVGGEYSYRPTIEGALRKLLRELGRAWLWALLLLGVAALASVRPRTVQLPGRGFGLAAGLLALLVLGGTLFVARVVLEGIPHVTDSVAYLFQARTFALGRLWAPTPALAEFFDHQHLLVQGERWFSKYPPGPALALLPGVLVGAPWISSPLLAALSIPLVYDLGRQAYGAGTALLAAALLALSPFFLFMSGDMMGHPLALLLTLAALSAAVRARRGSMLAAACCGLALGLLFVTRPLTALALVVPLTVGLLPVARRGLGPARRLAIALLGGAAPPLLGWLLYLWALTGSPFTNTMTLYWPYDRPGFGPEVGNLGGHDLARGVANTWINLLELNSQLFGWPVYLTLAPALVALVWPGRSRWDLWLAGVATLTSGAYVLWWFPGTIYGPRYTYEAIGALALLTARGLTVMASGARPALPAVLGSSRLPVGSTVLTGGLLALLIGWNFGLWLPRELRQHVGYNDVDRSRLNAVERAKLDNAIVFVAASPEDWQAYSSVFGANSPLLDGTVLYAHDLGSRRNLELLRLHPDRQGYLLTGTRLRRIS